MKFANCACVILKLDRLTNRMQQPAHYAVITCEIKLFWNNFSILFHM